MEKPKEFQQILKDVVIKQNEVTAEWGLIADYISGLEEQVKEQNRQITILKSMAGHLSDESERCGCGQSSSNCRCLR